MSKTIDFFKEIAQIPRESGNESGMAKYLCNFAQERNLEYHLDQYNNVLIKKKTSDQEVLILQAHTDMVCVSDNPFDFANNPIEVIEEDGYLHANGTTLGADNGIGVAQILNILDSSLPVNIEAIFTSSEETTMNGAKNFDTTKLTGKYLLNLDGFDENEIIRASAAYYDLEIDGEAKQTPSSYHHTYKVVLSGLLGGHSGYDLDKNRGNAIILLGEFLKNFDLEIISITGGTKNNVFPSKAEALINTDNSIDTRDFIAKYQSIYPNLKIDVTKEDYQSQVIANTYQLLELIYNFPSKVINYNEHHEPTTSLNLGVLTNNHLEIGMRSTIKKEANTTLEMLKNYAAKFGFNLNQVDSQPGFYSDENSFLIKKLIETCPYEPKATAKSLHITVEAGFFQEKMADLEIAIISPNIIDAHSTNERVSVESIAMTDKWLENFLKNF